MKYILTIALVTCALIYAGNSDYNDCIVTEMKDNGYYHELSVKYPNASEKELVKLYLDSIKGYGNNWN